MSHLNQIRTHRENEKAMPSKFFHCLQNILLTYFTDVTMMLLRSRGVQEPEYRSPLWQKLAFFQQEPSRTRSGYFWLEQEQEWFLAECF